MNNSETQQVIKELLNTLVELNKLIAQPGEKAHTLWQSVEFIKKEIRNIIKGYYGGL